ncbi:hypothetical protein O6U65_1363 [Saccharomyces cerevisiae synthetic construct]|uniref:Putative uncharacterized protein YJR038C n=1 Tax=Saccharomyces cerevisiae (strain ATCC 204508 / S288c) TaxID=559292 RepID=YJ08_YEAST
MTTNSRLCPSSPSSSLIKHLTTSGGPSTSLTIMLSVIAIRILPAGMRNWIRQALGSLLFASFLLLSSFHYPITLTLVPVYHESLVKPTSASFGGIRLSQLTMIMERRATPTCQDPSLTEV